MSVALDREADACVSLEDVCVRLEVGIIHVSFLCACVSACGWVCACGCGCG